MEVPQILVVDLGGQYALLIARRIRECGVRSAVLTPSDADSWLAANRPKGIILSGGWASVNDADAPHIPDSVLAANVPVFGICLGMQWLAKQLGGVVESSAGRSEYGIREFTWIGGTDPLFKGIAKKIRVRASHGDSVTVLPKHAYRTGSTPDCSIAGFSIPEKGIFAVQFHPETTDSECGSQILANFLEICGVTHDWNPVSMIRDICSEVVSALPPKASVVHLFSGGVDSTVVAAMLHPILRERLKCVSFNTGACEDQKNILRRAVAAKCFLSIMDMSREFFAALEGLTDAEEKRLAFQRTYDEQVERMRLEYKTPHVIQGTLAADLIKSGQQGAAAHIKTHHNVGIKSIQPLRNLFKDEVRELARTLNLPAWLSEQMPFPGPGYFIRVVGLPITQERVNIVRWADEHVRNILYDANVLSEISQLIVALTVKTTGVKGDSRRYGYTIVVRAMQSIDFMTGVGYEIPSPIRRCIKNTLSQHTGIVRVWFDEMDAPPATFELE